MQSFFSDKRIRHDNHAHDYAQTSGASRRVKRILRHERFVAIKFCGKTGVKLNKCAVFYSDENAVVIRVKALQNCFGAVKSMKPNSDFGQTFLNQIVGIVRFKKCAEFVSKTLCAVPKLFFLNVICVFGVT